MFVACFESGSRLWLGLGLESSHGRGVAKFSELLTWGSQYITRNMTSKEFVRATRPTFIYFLYTPVLQPTVVEQR